MIPSLHHDRVVFDKTNGHRPENLPMHPTQTGFVRIDRARPAKNSADYHRPWCKPPCPNRLCQGHPRSARPNWAWSITSRTTEPTVTALDGHPAATAPDGGYAATEPDDRTTAIV